MPITRTKSLFTGAFLTVFLAVALLCASVASAASKADDPAQNVPDPAVTALAGQFGLSLREAQARVDRQAAGEALTTDLEATLGADRFGGLWVDQANGGRYRAGVKDGKDDGTVAKLAEARGLGGLVDVVAVKHGIAKLRETARKLAAASDAAGKGDPNLALATTAVKTIKGAKDDKGTTPVTVGIDTSRNAVVLRTAADRQPTDAQARLVADAKATEGDAVVAETYRGTVAPAACTFPDCDPPLRGGVDIDNASIACTLGFNARSRSTNLPYALTAGHCTDAFGTWQAHFPDHSAHVIGTVRTTITAGNVDAGVITVNNPAGWNPTPWVVVTASSGPRPTTANNSYLIKRTAISAEVLGGYVCKTGSTTGTTCGIVSQLGFYDGYTTDLALTDMCVELGDSGGPVYAGNAAYGIVSSTVLDSSGHCAGASTYMGILAAQNALNVNILLAP